MMRKKTQFRLRIRTTQGNDSACLEPFTLRHVWPSAIWTHRPNLVIICLAKKRFHAVCDCSNYKRSVQFQSGRAKKIWFWLVVWTRPRSMTCGPPEPQTNMLSGSHLLLPSPLIHFDTNPNTRVSSWDGLGFWIPNINNQPLPHIKIYWLRHLAAIVTRLVLSRLSVFRAWTYLWCLCASRTRPKRTSFNFACGSKVYLT